MLLRVACCCVLRIKGSGISLHPFLSSFFRADSRLDGGQTILPPHVLHKATVEVGVVYQGRQSSGDIGLTEIAHALHLDLLKPPGPSCQVKSSHPGCGYTGEERPAVTIYCNRLISADGPSPCHHSFIYFESQLCARIRGRVPDES